MHQLRDLYSETKASESGDLIYLVAAYVDEDRNPRYMIPPVIHLGIYKKAVSLTASWLFQQAGDSDFAVIRKAIQLFDQYVLEAEVKCINYPSEK